MTQFDSPRDLLDAVGTDLGTSDWVDIAQERINAFADCTGDHQWIHVDTERAQQGPFGTTVAHGYLTLSLAPVFLADLVKITNVSAAVNYGLNQVRFPAPVPSGSRVRGHITLVSAEQRGAMVQAAFSVTVQIEGSERPGCVAEVVALFS